MPRRKPTARRPPRGRRQDHPGRHRARPEGPLLRHQPRALLRRDRPPFRPPRQPLLAGPARRRFHRACPASLREAGAARVGVRHHQSRRPHDRRRRRVDRGRAACGPQAARGESQALSAACRRRPGHRRLPHRLRPAAGHARAPAGALAGAAVWVLPNPSGLNANHQLPDLVRLFRELKRAASRLRQR